MNYLIRGNNSLDNARDDANKHTTKPNHTVFLSGQVTTVDMQKPPPDFRTNFEATHPPILIDNGLAILENDKIERHIMKNIPGGYNLFVQDKEVATLIENVYSKLKLMLLKREEQRNASLLAHLKKINDHLALRATRFLTGDTICCFDCELMPRLQHIRVAGKYFADFEIPVSYHGMKILLSFGPSHFRFTRYNMLRLVR